MTLPWNTLARVNIAEGLLELRQRGERDFLITLGGLILMNSTAHRSEVALGRLACSGLREAAQPRVLIGGLGMGYTLRAVLDLLPPTGRVAVAELNPVILDWCRGPLAPLTASAATDPRVEIEIVDVADRIRRAARERARFDAIVLDLYTGPHARTDRREDPLYGSRAIDRTRAALVPGGIFAVWGESYDAGFDRRLQTGGFSVTHERPGRGGLRHVVYVARAPGRKASGY